MRFNFKYICSVCFLLLITSCKVGRHYSRPQLDTPTAFRGETVLTSNNSTDTVILKPSKFFKNKTLLVLLDSAFSRNSDLLTAAKNLELAESRLRIAKLDFLPDLNLRLNNNYAKASKNSAVGQSAALGQSPNHRESQDYNASLDIKWDADIWGKIKREKEAAVAAYLESDEARKAVQTKLVMDVAKGYYNLLLLDEQHKIAIESKNLSDSTLAITRIQYQIGEASELGLSQVEAQVKENQILLSQIEQNLSIQENALSLLCGSFASEIEREFSIEGEFNVIPSDGYPVSVLTARPDIKALEYALIAANAKVGIAQANMYPALNISLTGGVNALEASDWFSVPASLFGTVAGSITQPIFQKGRLKAAYNEARIEREKSVIAFRQGVLDGYAQVSDALKNRFEIRKQLLYAKEREKALWRGVRSADVLYKAGVTNYLDVISVQSNYLQARLQVAAYAKDQATSNIELYYALGGGWE